MTLLHTPLNVVLGNNLFLPYINEILLCVRCSFVEALEHEVTHELNELRVARGFEFGLCRNQRSVEKKDIFVRNWFGSWCISLLVLAFFFFLLFDFRLSVLARLILSAVRLAESFCLSFIHLVSKLFLSSALFLSFLQLSKLLFHFFDF